MFFTYVLQSQKDKQFYIDYTPDDVYNRTEKHQQGFVPATKLRRPLKLIFFEAYLNQADALRRERYFKTTKGKTALRSMLKEYLKTC